MAQFDQAVDVVLSNEGGLVADRNDAGGLTNFGISQKAYPERDIKSLTVDQAKKIYLDDYWTIHHFDSLPSQAVANKVFDLGVNIGPSRAIRIFQQALSYFGVGPTVADGKIGPATISAASRVPDDKLLPELRARAAHFHGSLAVDPKYASFLLGWLRRDVQ